MVLGVKGKKVKFHIEKFFCSSINIDTELECYIWTAGDCSDAVCCSVSITANKRLARQSPPVLQHLVADGATAGDGDRFK